MIKRRKHGHPFIRRVENRPVSYISTSIPDTFRHQASNLITDRIRAEFKPGVNARDMVV